MPRCATVLRGFYRLEGRLNPEVVRRIVERVVISLTQYSIGWRLDTKVIAVTYPIDVFLIF
jgi:hypothetical protein